MVPKRPARFLSQVSRWGMLVMLTSWPAFAAEAGYPSLPVAETPLTLRKGGNERASAMLNMVTKLNDEEREREKHNLLRIVKTDSSE